MPTEKEIVDGLVSELRRGTIVLSVLAQLDTPQYGYSLVKLLCDKGMDIETNTLYPLLRRLESQCLLHSTWETAGAKPRKYYGLTAQGKTVYNLLKKSWNETVSSMAKLLEEDIG